MEHTVASIPQKLGGEAAALSKAKCLCPGHDTQGGRAQAGGCAQALARVPVYYIY